jgi:hypothetical protein
MIPKEQEIAMLEDQAKMLEQAPGGMRKRLEGEELANIVSNVVVQTSPYVHYDVF